jgi:prepilin-type N-terminal cleavage/methylation domain-containing protein
MEWWSMEIVFPAKKLIAPDERGMSLIELMIALVVLLIGVVGSMSLIGLSIGGNGRSRQQSNSTTIVQMMVEKISSVKASTSPNLTLSDCAGNSFTISTAVGGSALTSSGVVDFTQAAVSNYQVLFTDCATGGMQFTYDVRWNITQPTPYIKFLVVSAQKQNAGNDAKYFSLPVTIRALIGQGT